MKVVKGPRYTQVVKKIEQFLGDYVASQVSEIAKRVGWDPFSYSLSRADVESLLLKKIIGKVKIMLPYLLSQKDLDIGLPYPYNTFGRRVFASRIIEEYIHTGNLDGLCRDVRCYINIVEEALKEAMGRLEKFKKETK